MSGPLDTSLRGLTAILLLTGAISCGSSAPADTIPTTPTPQSYTISGSIRVHSANGVAPVSGAVLFGLRETRLADGTSSRAFTGEIPVDASGRYSYSVEGTTTRLVLIAHGFRTSAWQPCVRTVLPAQSTAGDIDVVGDADFLGPALPDPLAARTPMVSGVVYEQTPAGRVPLQNASMSLTLDDIGLVVAYTFTDREGRYTLCGLPQDRRVTIWVYSEDLNDSAKAELAAGQRTLDLQLTRR